MAKNKKSPKKVGKDIKMAKVSKASLSRKTTKGATQSKPKRAFFQLDQQIWPLERDILFRPDRMKYVRKLIKPQGCVFCVAREQVSFESLCVYQTKHSAIVLNKFPYNTGHLLVIPKRHAAHLLDLSQEEYADLHDCVQTALKALQECYEPGGLNLGMNLGAVAGAGIPEHLHYHLIPRWAGDLNFFPLIAETKAVIESLEQTFERLINYFKKNK